MESVVHNTGCPIYLELCSNRGSLFAVVKRPAAKMHLTKKKKVKIILQISSKPAREIVQQVNVRHPSHES
jgi:hypothetical protein